MPRSVCYRNRWDVEEMSKMHLVRGGKRWKYRPKYSVKVGSDLIFFVSDGEADTVMSKTVIDNKHRERRVYLPCLYANLHTDRLFVSSSHITGTVNLPVSMCLRFYSLVMR